MSGVRIPPPRPLFRPYRHGRRSWEITESVVAVAHQVEHRIVAPEVVGSRPISHPIFQKPCNYWFAFRALCNASVLFANTGLCTMILTCLRSGIWQAELRVPEDVRDVIGKIRFAKSMRTRNKREAVVKAAPILE